tara:strand:- start:140 stop:646 length:507 start_codon:yes stop_codon:yes gene_type:complete
VLAITLAVCSIASAQQAQTGRTVSSTEQRIRDSDRVAVLNQELKKSEDQLASLARRKAERLAAADAQGAAEAEEQHRRTLSDVAALKRELGLVSTQASAPNDDRSTASAAKPSGQRAPALGPSKPPTPAAAPWWDVYGQGRSPTPPTPISQAPATSAAPTPVSGRRLE